MAQDLPLGGSEDEVHEEEIVDQPIYDQNTQINETDSANNPLEDLGYRHLEGVGHSQGMIFDEQDIR